MTRVNTEEVKTLAFPFTADDLFLFESSRRTLAKAAIATTETSEGELVFDWGWASAREAFIPLLTDLNEQLKASIERNKMLAEALERAQSRGNHPRFAEYLAAFVDNDRPKYDRHCRCKSCNGYRKDFPKWLKTIEGSEAKAATL